MTTINIISLFPEVFENYLKVGMLAKASQKNIIQFNLVNLRDFGLGKNLKVDDTPYGGGGGMILQIEPLVTAIEKIKSESKRPLKVILLTPRGELFNQEMAKSLAGLKEDLLFIGGRYEGYDERLTNWVDIQISIGNFILTGFELPALLVVDAIVRLYEGVLGNPQAIQNDSFSSNSNFIEYPQYTKPEIFRGLSVPKVLLSGHHQDILDWKKQQMKTN